jgi:hypothetical protein
MSNIQKRLALSIDEDIHATAFIRADFNLTWCNNILINQEEKSKGRTLAGSNFFV